MDQHVEKQVLEQLQAGDLGKFNLLVDEYFDDIYRYIFRRVMDHEATRNILLNVFADGLSQAKEATFDVNFKVWILAIAKIWVWRHLEQNGFPKLQGVIAKPDFLSVKENKKLLDDFANMMAKLSLQEKEYVRLKFFEEMSDYDVAYITNAEPATISQNILRVIKRVHLLLFGASDDSSVYFAKVSGELSKIRVMEDIEVDYSYKLDVKADVARRITAKDFAIDVETIDKREVYKDAKGSNDPAKIFVEAVREMREEQQNEFDNLERMSNFFERFGALLVAVFIFIFVLFLGLSGYKYYKNNVRLIVRGYPTVCENVDFARDFNDTERRYLNVEISDLMCEKFAATDLSYERISRTQVNFDLETKQDFREYEVEKVNNIWYVRKYAKTAHSD